MIALLAALRAALAALRSTAGIVTVCTVLAGGAGLLLGWRYADALGDQRVALCEQRSSNAVAAAERAARKRIEAAQTAGDVALAGERQRVQAANQTSQELRHALKIVTTDRVCLGRAAVGLLNRAPGIAAAGLPNVASGAADPAAAAAAAAADGTSEADTADWIVGAAAQYEQCRARVDAVAAWQRGVSNAR